MKKPGVPSVALIGCGQWGKNIARNLAELGALSVICDGDAVRAGKVAADLGVEFSLTADAAFERSDIVAVAIATPAVTHAQVIGKALDAGKHVYVEKPIALSVSDAEAVAAKAAEKKLTLMTGHLLQYHPVFVRLLDLVRTGALGNLQYVYSNRLNQGRVRTEENALWSLAPHDISMILALAGTKPHRVSATGRAAVQKNIADIATATFEFASGVQAHLFCSWLNPYKEHRLAVIGDKSMAVFDDSAAKWEDKLVVYSHHVEWQNGMPEFVKGAGETIAVPKGEPLRDEIAHFLSCVEGKTACRTGPDEAIPVLEVLAAAQQAMDTAKPVEL